MIELPIDAHVPAIVGALNRARAVVVVADPGAGKTTRVPPALADEGPAILLQPRRVAARAIARRIAEERGWVLGREVGWHIRFERRFNADTKLLVATEGILTARLQQDPLLSSFHTIVFDEFHERSLHADVGIALAKQAWLARRDLRLVVMSATLDATAVSAFLGGCPVVTVRGRVFPIDISFAPGQPVADAASELVLRTSGDVLCFLPGAAEIERTLASLRGRVASDIELLPLYGAMDTAEQDRAFHPGERRRVIVATNIAETSITVPRVAAVVDSGLQKVARYDVERAIDTLMTERIPQDSADQRAGRAGRTAPGAAIRLWDPRDRLRPHREPEIHRVDLSATVLDIVGWGGDPHSFEWLEAPRAGAIDAAVRLLERLGALEAGRVTDTGRLMQQLPLHPRLARILMSGGDIRDHARACAILAEHFFIPPRAASTSSDLLSAIDDWDRLPSHIHHVAREIERLASCVLSSDSVPGPRDERRFLRAILAGYPDRVGQRRYLGSSRVRLSSGAGAVIAPESGVRDGEFIVAIDVQGSTRPNDPDSRVRVASRVDRDWLEPTAFETVHRVDADGVVRAVEVERYDALILGERPAGIDPDVAADLLADVYLRGAVSEEGSRLMHRLRFAGRTVDLEDLVRRAAYGARSVREIRLESMLSREVASMIARDAPESLKVPSGRSVRLDYNADGTVSTSVKLQELFGLAETPRIGPRREPVVLSLLAPNGRPVQVTRDLRSFWDRTYPEVRKELRGRYPKHPWPEDPWNAVPTARTTRKVRD